MPKETFFNLPDKKREKIEQEIIKEFAEYGYENASINRMVEACKIAKGSFYQYFEDKKDVFRYVLEMIMRKKFEFMSPELANPENVDFFDLIKELWISGVRFANSSPELVKIGNNMLKNINAPIYKELLGEKQYVANDVYEDLLIKAIEKNEVRQDIDVKYVSAMLTSMNYGAVEHYLSQQESVVENRDIFNEKILETVDLFIDFIRNGIANK